MLFFKRVMRKLGNKLLWFPQLMTVGKPADTEELAGRLSAISTVSKGDVHIDGLGSFYLSCTSRGNGVETKEEVNESQIKGLKVVFLPERRRGGDRKMRRPLVRQDMEFIEWLGK